MPEKLTKTKYTGIFYKENSKTYVVNLDCGREKVFDDKTGQYRMKQIKVRKTALTLKDARAIQDEHNLKKRQGKLHGTLSAVSFFDLATDYVNSRRSRWSDSYTERQGINITRIQSYLILIGQEDKPVRTFCVADIEKFFEWCTQRHDVKIPKKKADGEGYEMVISHIEPLGYNSLSKTKSFLKDLNKWACKDFNKYGVEHEIVSLCEIPAKKTFFEATPLDEDQLNNLIRYSLDHELHSQCGTSLIILVMGACMGMRKGEILGAKWSDFIPGPEGENAGRLAVLRQRQQLKTGMIVTVPKMGNKDGKSMRERRQRYTACSEKCMKLLLMAREEQKCYRKITDDDYIFQDPSGLLGGYLPNVKHLDRRWREFQTRYNKEMKKMGQPPLPHFRLHDLRHTFAQMLRGRDVELYKISYSMGHLVGGNTTSKIYLHDDGIVGRQEINCCIDDILITDLARHDYYNEDNRGEEKPCAE